MIQSYNTDTVTKTLENFQKLPHKIQSDLIELQERNVKRLRAEKSEVNEYYLQTHVLNGMQSIIGEKQDKKTDRIINISIATALILSLIILSETSGVRVDFLPRILPFLFAFSNPDFTLSDMSSLS